MARMLAMLMAALLASFFAGWQANDWRRDSLELVINQAASAAGDESRAAMQKVASQSARELETTLEALRNAKPPKEIYREMVKPVFTNVCLSAEYVSLYNATVEQTERALSRKPENKVSGK